MSVDALIESKASEIARRYMDMVRSPGDRLVLALVLMRAAMIIITETINDVVERMEQIKAAVAAMGGDHGGQPQVR